MSFYGGKDLLKEKATTTDTHKKNAPGGYDTLSELSRAQFLKTLATVCLALLFFQTRFTRFAKAAEWVDARTYTRKYGDTEGMRRCFAENLYVDLAGATYRIEMLKIKLRSGHRIRGNGARVIRIQNGSPSGNAAFVNDSVRKGVQDVIIEGITFDGNPSDVSQYWKADANQQRTSGSALQFTTLEGAPECRDVVIRDVWVLRWPGVAIRTRNGSRFRVVNTHVRNPARGGIVFTRNCNYTDIRHSTSLGCGDDAIAINSADPELDKHHGSGYCRKNTVYNVRVSQRHNAPHGAGVVLRGCRKSKVIKMHSRGARNGGLVISQQGPYTPRDITARNVRVVDSRIGLRVVTDHAVNIRCQGVVVGRSTQYSFKVQTLSRRRAHIGVRVTHSKSWGVPRGRDVYIQKGVRGTKIHL